MINKLPWSTRRRLHFLEFKLFWEGRVNRSDLMEAFKISTPQASADISNYQEMAPGNIIYDPSRKYYLPTEEFSPKFIQPTADAYFSEITSVLKENYNLTSDGIGSVPKPTRIMNTDFLKKIIQSIKNKEKIKIDYRSFKNPEPGHSRWISPHAFAFDGFRWHVRAYCHIDNKFKDYVLGRIASIFETEKTDIDIQSDNEWFYFKEVLIGPNPSLSEDQQKLIAMDYGMENKKLVIKCRISLIWYLLKRLGLEKSDDKCQCEGQHIVLINKDEIYSVIYNV